MATKWVYMVYSDNKIIKVFKHENEAISFVTNDEKVFQYGQLTLKRGRSETNMEVYNERTESWEAE